MWKWKITEVRVTQKQEKEEETLAKTIKRSPDERHTNTRKRPRGKESTEVRKSQIKGKESENSYQELKKNFFGRKFSSKLFPRK